jgi:hypothetical protein
VKPEQDRAPRRRGQVLLAADGDMTPQVVGAADAEQ